MDYEYTNTCGGKAVYSWIHRGRVNADSMIQALKLAKLELDMVGVKGDIIAEFGDMISWKPRGCCTILMIKWRNK